MRSLLQSSCQSELICCCWITILTRQRHERWELVGRVNWWVFIWILVSLCYFFWVTVKAAWQRCGWVGSSTIGKCTADFCRRFQLTLHCCPFLADAHCACWQTGTAKYAVFALPLLQRSLTDWKSLFRFVSYHQSESSLHNDTTQHPHVCVHPKWLEKSYPLRILSPESSLNNDTTQQPHVCVHPECSEQSVRIIKAGNHTPPPRLQAADSIRRWKNLICPALIGPYLLSTRCLLTC